MNDSLAGGAVARIKKGGARAFKAGGLWIYDNEIARVDGSFEDGDILAVEDFDGYFLGWGFINRASTISIRMLSRKKEQAITPAFLEERVRAAWEYRKKVIDTSSCRVIFGEADFLPGLTVDKYEDVLVVESLALGIDRLKPMILNILTRILSEDGIQVRGIYERSDAKVREKEGLPRTKGFIGEPFDTLVPIRENSVRYIVDVENGQKTGFFLDQRDSRQAVGALSKGKKVLNLFCYTGGFSLYALDGGAESVCSVDSSRRAMELVEKNVALAGYDENKHSAVSGAEFIILNRNFL
jgi:23S rRNA (cytosine1962-C5)-methyltransferase